MSKPTTARAATVEYDLATSPMDVNVARIINLQDRLETAEANVEFMSGGIDHHTRRIKELEATIKELKAQLADCRRLLKMTICPNDLCDNKGTVCLGEYQHDNGEVEAHLEQCQFCDERDQAIQEQE